MVENAGVDWNPIEKAIFERRSVRNYQDKQVPEGILMRILEAGRFAPSAGNFMPWKILVIRDKKLLEELESDAKKICSFYHKYLLTKYRSGLLGFWGRLNTRLMMLIYPNKAHPDALQAIPMIATDKMKAFWSAPTLLFLLKDKRGCMVPELDVGICGQNMAIAAHSHGLGSCWLGTSEVLKFGPQWLKWKRRFQIEYPYELLMALALGYPKGKQFGEVERETRQIDWYEDEIKKTVY